MVCETDRYFFLSSLMDYEVVDFLPGYFLITCSVQKKTLMIHPVALHEMSTEKSSTKLNMVHGSWSSVKPTKH